MCIISIEKVVLFIFFYLFTLCESNLVPCQKNGFDHPFYNQMHVYHHSLFLYLLNNLRQKPRFSLEICNLRKFHV